MDLLGIADESVIARHEGEDAARAVTKGNRTVAFTYHELDPDIHSDGLGRVEVAPTDDDTYRIGYWGAFNVGAVRVTREGVAELGAHFFADRATPPRWYLDPEAVTKDDPPWWLPEGTEIRPAFDCTRCGESVPGDETLRPRRPPFDGNLVCRDCWTAER